ncbi:MAG: NUDIX hydrolase [Ktedonobacterales bacterium]|nr:NUDIX hydrolase [Ktedonobacterales bacterium]
MSRVLTKTPKTREEKHTAAVWHARFWLAGATGSSALAAVLFFNPSAIPDMADLLGSTNAAQPLAVGSTVLSVFLLVGTLISWTSPYTAPILPSYTAMRAEEESLEKKEGLKPDKVLEKAFEYAAGTAEQAMEHRMTIVNFYLLIAGGAGSGVVALVSANPGIAVAAVPLLWLIAAIGGMISLQLMALRRAWAGSVVEMNYIREFFIANNNLFKGEALAKAFLWNPKTMPDTHKRGNVFYYAMLLIAVLDAAAFFGGIFLLGFDEHATLTTPVGFISAGTLAVAFLMLHLWVYNATLIPFRAPSVAPEAAPAQQSATSTTIPRGVRMQPVTFSVPEPSAPANTITGTNERYHGQILNLRVDDVRLPNGTDTQREIVELAPAVVIIPYLEANDAFLFIEQYRDAVGQTLIELPAGKVKTGEDMAAAAKRELLEETGYAADEVRLLGRYYASPGYSNEEHHLYLATKLTQVSGIQDTEEVHAIHTIARADAVQMTKQGAFTDGKTVVGVLWGDRELPTHV